MLNDIVVFKRLREIILKYYILPQNGRRYTRTFLLKLEFMFGIVILPAMVGNILYLWRILSQDKISLASTLESIHVNAEIVATALTGFTALHYGNEILEFFYHLGVHKFDEPDNLAEVYAKHDKITNYSYYLTKITIIAKIALNLVKNSFCEAKEKFLDERYFCGMMLPCWFPLRMHIVAKIWIFVTSSSLYFIYIPIAALSYFVDYGISDLIVLRMKKMKQMLEQLDFRLPREMIKKQLVECIEYHSEIWNLLKNMNDSIGWCHAGQYSLASGIIALVEYELIVVRKLSIWNFLAMRFFADLFLFVLIPIQIFMIIYVSYPNRIYNSTIILKMLIIIKSFNVTAVIIMFIWITGEFMICYAGQAIENEREAMATALYMTAWHDLPMELKSTFNIFLAKMLIPLHFEAKPMIHMNYKFFMKVLKASYSFLMYLQSH